MRVKPDPFRGRLEELINEFRKENTSDTPDYILANFLDDCLKAFDRGVNARRAWHRPYENTKEWWTKLGDT